MVFEIVAIFFLLIINGVFSMSEMAVVSARKARLQQRANQGSRRAQAALALANDPGPFLSTVQIGITLVGILAGAFGGSSLAERLAPSLAGLPYIGPYSATVAFVIVVSIITYFSLVIGELIPKRLALNGAEGIAARIALPMRGLAKVATPLVKLLDGSTNGLLRLFGLREAAEHPVTEDEIKVMIEQGISAGVFVEAERQMIERVFHLADRRVNEIMIPRSEIVWLDADDAPAEIRATIAETHHSRFPVAQGGLDNVLGVVRAKDLLTQCLMEQPLDLRAAMLPTHFVPENMPAFKLLESFRQARQHIALVVDEFGGVEGMVTVNDLLQAIVGTLPTRGPQRTQQIQRDEDGSYVLDGALSIAEFKSLLGIKSLPGEETGTYQTLAGFVMKHLARIPIVGDSFEWEGFRVEVVALDRKRVSQVRVSSNAPSTSE